MRCSIKYVLVFAKVKKKLQIRNFWFDYEIKLM